MKWTRLASLLLLLASPALGGTLLPVLHPCPVDAPWTLAGGDHADHGNHHPAPAQAPEGTLTIVPASIAAPPAPRWSWHRISGPSCHRPRFSRGWGRPVPMPA